MNVGKKIIDRPLIWQNFGHQHHLCTGEVLWMGAANTLLEVMQLSRQIPVTHVGQPRGHMSDWYLARQLHNFQSLMWASRGAFVDQIPWPAVP